MNAGSIIARKSSPHTARSEGSANIIIKRAEPREEGETMRFKMIHENYNVADLEKSLAFYGKALGLAEKRRKAAADGSFVIVYVGNDASDFELELTWLRDHPGRYDIGEAEFHLAFRVDDFEAARRLHEEMDCVVYENQNMDIYFIEDPDGYWLEIVPTR